jgi:hypothetical protein
VKLRCVCGHTIDDIAAPNDVEHLLVNYRAMERLQDLVDEECAADGSIDLWPEHWEESGAVEVWKCPFCERLYVDPKAEPEDVVVYSIKRIGLPPQTD